MLRTDKISMLHSFKIFGVNGGCERTDPLTDEMMLLDSVDFIDFLDLVKTLKPLPNCFGRDGSWDGEI